MLCSECPEYNNLLQRCLRGKVNLKTRGNTFEIIGIMGRDYICSHNEFKVDLVEQIDRLGEPEDEFNFTRGNKDGADPPLTELPKLSVITKCVNCGTKREILPGEIDEGDMPHCDCGSPIICDSVSIDYTRGG